jgi:hypothetical protein
VTSTREVFPGFIVRIKRAARESSRTHRLARISFEFHLDDLLLPPDDYTVASAAIPGSVKLRDETSGESFHIFPLNREPGRSEPKLVFRRYGVFHFLSQIWMPGHRGYNLAQGNLELEMKKEAPRYTLVSVPVDRR